ncbi:MAG TPA: polyprenyl synthetase family protein [Phycisphaerales bacterium]|nr:polyprenyl synthetase family protein [Phycisphaerales bacterium]HMP37733.1 polyprenyl synthetase family protein [Phycisphaerales bacterium]
MNQTATESYLDTIAPIVADADRWLVETLGAVELPDRLRAAAGHAVLVGGKRLRPLLAILCCEAAGGAREDARPAAVAIELVHAFSLVHDDLPALDNDALRRGEPTVHVKFGEAMAILAGDVLLSIAFEVAAGAGDRLCGDLASATTRMISGQVLDTLGGFDVDERDAEARLHRIHREKTGALLVAACRMGARCAGADERVIAAVSSYGEHIGLMFQIVDDLLDVTQSTEHLGKAANKDESAGKLTFPAVHGIEHSRRAVARLHAAAIEALGPLGSAARPLKDLAAYMAVRTR